MGAPPAVDCPSENSLAAFADGTLDPRRCGQLEGHVDVCSHCRTLLLGLLSEDSGDPSAQVEEQVLSSGVTSSTRIEVNQRIGRYVVERLVAWAAWARSTPRTIRSWTAAWRSSSCDRASRERPHR